MRYKYRNILVGAIQFKGDENLQEVLGWLNRHGVKAGGDNTGIITINDKKYLSGEWLIKPLLGDIISLDDTQFKENYLPQ